MDYSTLLTDDQKRELLAGRIQQFAAEAYQHSLNKQVAEQLGNEAAVAEAQTAIEQLDTALTVHIDELNKLAPAVLPALDLPPVQE